MTKNSNEEELKRERRSLIGKIDRRQTSIMFMQSDIRDMRLRLRLVEDQLAEFKKEKS